MNDEAMKVLQELEDQEIERVDNEAAEEIERLGYFDLKELRKLGQSDKYGSGKSNRREMPVTFNPPTFKMLQGVVRVGKGGYGSPVVDLAVRFMLSVLTSDMSEAMFVARDLRKSLTQSGIEDMATRLRDFADML